MFAYRRDRLARFFSLLPRSTRAALALARRRDARLHGRARLSIDAERPLRHAVEIRHPSFMNDDFVSLLKEHGIGLVVADTAGKWPKMLHATADFVYVRLHGDIEIYTSGYSDQALAGWARRIRGWDRDGRDVYVYFDNDAKVKAPFDALRLMRHGARPGTWARIPRTARRAGAPRTRVDRWSRRSVLHRGRRARQA